MAVHQNANLKANAVSQGGENLTVTDANGLKSLIRLQTNELE